MKVKLKYIVFLFTPLISSCLNADCEQVSEIYREKECLLIVNDIPYEYGVDFKIKGTSLKTGKDTLYDEENRWFSLYFENIEKRDTIIKKKGELVFSIHKKDTVLSFNYECDGKVYK